MVNIFYVNLRVKSDSYRQHLTPPFVFFGDNPNLFSPTSQFFSLDFSSSTGQCTCVHRPVDDGKSAESGWNIGGKQLGIPYLTILVDHFSLCL